MKRLFSLVFILLLALSTKACGAPSIVGEVWEAGGGSYNINAFGAIPDDAGDDTTAIQAAIDAAENAGGGIVFIPTGTYNCATTLTLPSSVAIQGAGEGSIISYSGSSYAIRSDNAADETVEVNYVMIRDLQLIGTASASHCIYGIGFKHSRFENLIISGFSQAGSYGIYLSGNAGAGYVGSFYNVIRDCVITSNDNGIMLTGTNANGQANSNIITGGKIGSFEGYGINCDEANQTLIVGAVVEAGGTVAGTATYIRINDRACAVLGCRLEHYDNTDSSIGILLDTGATIYCYIAGNMITGYKGGQYLSDLSSSYSNVIVQPILGLSLAKNNLRLQPFSDSTAFFQLLDASDNPIFHINSTNRRVGINTDSPYCDLQIGAGGIPSFSLTTYSGSPDVRHCSSTNDDEISYGLYVNDGANNKRVKFFLDDSSGTYGLWGTQSSGVPSFVIGNGTTTQLSIDPKHNVAVGSGALATDADNGFLYIPGGNGVPTGTPTSKTGLFPLYFDYANNDLYIYNSGWQQVSP